MRIGTEEIETPRGRGRMKPVRRPLVVVLAVCLLGEGLMLSTGAGPLLPVAMAGILLLLGRGRNWSVHGLGVVSLAALLALSGLRQLEPAAPTHSRRIGRWRSVGSGSELVGRLQGQAGLYEVPPGSLRDGEWVELLPGRTPRPPARGPLAPALPPRPAPIKLWPDEVRRLAPGSPWGLDHLRRALTHLRQSGLERLESLDSPIARGLASAVLFGDRSKLPAGSSDLFTRTGTRHVLAVSGLHVGLIASLCVWPLGRLLAWILRSLQRCSLLGNRRWQLIDWLGRPQVWRVLLLALFAPLAGSQAPVVRATLALALAQVAGLIPIAGHVDLRRRPDSLSLWAFSGWLEWLADPHALRSLSLQLSYLATLGLLVMGPALVNHLRARLPGGGLISETSRAGHRRSPLCRVLGQKLVDFAIGGLAASIAASLATLPLLWWVFGEWSLTGPLATMAILPLLALFLLLAWVWLLAPVAMVELALVWCAESMVSALEAFDGLPGTPVPLPTRPLWLLLLGGTACFLALGRQCRDGAERWLRLAALCWGIAICPWWRGPRDVELYVLDVGNGTAAVLRAPGELTWIFDAGSRDRTGVARSALAPLLRELDVGPVGVALSHADADHARALPWLIERYPPSIWLGSLTAQLKERLPHSCLQVDLERGRLDGTLGSGADGSEGWSLLRGQSTSGNEGSRSLEFRLGGRSILLCGDAEASGLAAQLRLGAIRGPYSVVLFPHHGSETPWLTPFLDATLPGEIWISASDRPQVASELDRRGLNWKCTSRDGPLEAHW